jgi:hypothetical protein
MWKPSGHRGVLDRQMRLENASAKKLLLLCSAAMTGVAGRSEASGFRNKKTHGHTYTCPGRLA